MTDFRIIFYVFRKEQRLKIVGVVQMGVNLEKELIANLNELTGSEQDAIKVFSALYINSCQNLKNEKMVLFDENLTQEIEFYGRKREKYLEEIHQMLAQYAELLDSLVRQYDTWVCAVIMNLQKAYNQQKIAIADVKMSIDLQKETRRKASEQKISHYEIVIGECKRQLQDCKVNMEKKIGELFFDQGKQINVVNTSILQKVINLFIGKSKVEQFVIKRKQLELENLSMRVKQVCEEIQQETIAQVATIEDVMQQVQDVFKRAIKE